MVSYYLPVFQTVKKRLTEPRCFLQILTGPRQVGKSTLAQQMLAAWAGPKHFATADEPTSHPKLWLQQQWQIARMKTNQYRGQEVLLVLDEIQKMPDWSSGVKYHWDEDSRLQRPIKVLLLGSSNLLLAQGLSESLMGRFELIPITHWSYTEMRDAFDWSLEQYIYFGGYPGSALFIKEEARWSYYIQNAICEPSISRDVLAMTRVDKPALLRQVFELGCLYSGQIVALQKILGQLQDAGNATTLSHYLKLLSQARLLTGISKYAGQAVRSRASSPKFQVYNTALLTASALKSFQEALENPVFWGRLVESCVGAHLCNQALLQGLQIYYWREGSYEVDFVVKQGDTIVALEVKSADFKGRLSGLETFVKKFKPKKHLQIGGQGLSLESFLTMSCSDWLF